MLISDNVKENDSINIDNNFFYIIKAKLFLNILTENELNNIINTKLTSLKSNYEEMLIPSFSSFFKKFKTYNKDHVTINIDNMDYKDIFDIIYDIAVNENSNLKDFYYRV
jgi:hypothetical protein